MSYSQLASSSSGNRCGRQHGQTASDSIDFVQLSVGIAEGRFVFDFFHDLCLFLCYLVVMLKVDHAKKETWTLFQLRALYKGTCHASRLERTSPRLHSRVTRVTPRPLETHVSPATTFTADVSCMIGAMRLRLCLVRCLPIYCKTIILLM